MKINRSEWGIILFLLAAFMLLVPAATSAATIEGPALSSPNKVDRVFYENPPGVMPVIYLSGSEYEMGFQYGQQAGGYIEIVKDGLWASLLSRYDKAVILDKLTKYESYVKELPKIDYLQILKGIADGAQNVSHSVTYKDVLAINYQVELEWLPLPKSSCTNMAVWGKATVDGKTIAGSNFDFPWGNGYSYRAIIVAYPSNGNAFVSIGIAGMLGNNFLMNDKGLVYMSNKSANKRPEDIGYGVTDFIMGPYVAMTCSNAEEAKDTLLSVKATNGINRLVVDEKGDAYAVEVTAATAKARKSGDFGEKDYLITTNHFVNPEMKAAQKPWEPKAFYPASWYRYETVAKFIEDSYGKVDARRVRAIMASTKYWDGDKWHDAAGWTGNTVNRFLKSGATLASKVGIPSEKMVYICTGNPHMPYWGTGAPGQTGQYVKLQLTDSPRSTANSAKKVAFSELLSIAKFIGSRNIEKQISIPATLALGEQLDLVRMQYWRGVRYFAKACLAEDQEALQLYGKASTEFNKVQARTEFLKGLLMP